ncbi:ferric reductase-like transmembrane domain-containing protein [Neobacillus citreus]|uniref:Ferric reductase-like transmembrane domain-containing protein n=1 Tax=Neobacillus citreus TaxID=2833578 RepID=A0A942T1P1_9BACI|nr:ferric reductase-like transmembrane domain-containing protein [Neobacillus citreus]MCH6265832.1 ferric reductase-like transmembrane domain-containing protein [Neobacillus citreus]
MEMFEWYLIRTTGTIAYVLLYLSVMIGLYTQVQKKRKQKIAIPLIWHESLSNWAFILTLGHVVITLIDQYMSFQWFDVLIPFQTDYQPIPMALGILALYFLILTIVTSKARKAIGYQAFRKVHALNPILYIFTTMHGLMMGTDFQGIIVAAVNLLPFMFFGILLLKGKKELDASHL